MPGQRQVVAHNGYKKGPVEPGPSRFSRHEGSTISEAGPYARPQGRKRSLAVCRFFDGVRGSGSLWDFRHGHPARPQMEASTEDDRLRLSGRACTRSVRGIDSGPRKGHLRETGSGGRLFSCTSTRRGIPAQPRVALRMRSTIMGEQPRSASHALSPTADNAFIGTRRSRIAARTDDCQGRTVVRPYLTARLSSRRSPAGAPSTSRRAFTTLPS